jgi:DNA-binding GntR family transcriptional regulator
LMRLESEGLVQRDGKNWAVSPLNLDELRSLYEYREVLESASARLAIERASRDDLDALAELGNGVDSSETPEHSLDAGTSFHLALARLSGNRFLIDAMDGVLTRLYRTRWLEVQSAEARERVHREHDAIVTALRARDGASAELATSGSRHPSPKTVSAFAPMESSSADFTALAHPGRRVAQRIETPTPLGLDSRAFGSLLDHR